MKKFLYLIFFSLLLGGNAYAEATSFKCLNTDGTEAEYILSIDLKKKLINRAGIPYKIIKITDTALQAKNENAEFSNLLIFNRYSGNIQLQIYYKKKYTGAEKNDLNLKELANYRCKKTEKLI